MRKKLPFIIAAVIATCFIFSNSIQNAESSGAESRWIVSFIIGISDRLGIVLQTETLTVVVRKLAHITEFMLQAVLVAGCFDMPYRKRIIYILFLGLFTACTDEYIQFFSDGRGSMVQDVFIDFFGTALGTAVSGILYKSRRR